MDDPNAEQGNTCNLQFLDNLGFVQNIWLEILRFRDLKMFRISPLSFENSMIGSR